MQILLIEDDPRVASFVQRGLEEENYAVQVAEDGDQGTQAALAQAYDLIILDWMLPKKDGLEVLKQIRDNKITSPILMLTAKDEMGDKVRGLDAGADDYLTKPFSFEELLARIRALFRRRGDMMTTVLQAGSVELDTLRHRATLDGRPITLTNREYSLLEYFLRRPNEVVTRSMLAKHVWEHDFDTLSNVIDVHIARLRRKLEDDASQQVLQTVRGQGYRLNVPQPS